MTSLAVGAATRDITPDWPISLAGFASRNWPSQGAKHPLHVRVIVLENEGGRIVIAGADLLNWGAQQAPQLRQTIADLAGTTDDRVLLSATHSHSGPQTTFNLTKDIGVADHRFLDLLNERTIEATRAALASIEPVTLQRTQTVFDLGFYRRETKEQGPTDNRLSAIRMHRGDGSLKALLVHYTCHPVIVDEPFLSGEFPGFAMSRIETDYNTTALYLQGFCGDINPDYDGKMHSRRGTDADVQATGNRLADQVESLLRIEGSVTENAPLVARQIQVDLPFQTLPTNDELRAGCSEPGIIGEWSQLMLDHPDKVNPSIPLTLHRLDLAQHLSLLAINAEMSVAYGLRLRERTDDSVLPVGYSNGMIGYVTTAQQVIEGGYEPIESSRYYALPAPFSTDVEAIVDAAINSIAS